LPPVVARRKRDRQAGSHELASRPGSQHGVALGKCVTKYRDSTGKQSTISARVADAVKTATLGSGCRGWDRRLCARSARIQAAMWVRPLGRVDQAQFLPKVDPKTRAREYYAQYPESYIRINRESWRYDSGSGTAYHKFTLTNQAMVGYDSIRIELTYKSPQGRPCAVKRSPCPADSRLRLEGDLQSQVKHVPPTATRLCSAS